MVYHVASHGNDSNPGTSTLPFCTIQKGVNSLILGDKLHVHAGTYPERPHILFGGTPSSLISFQAIGPVTVNGWNVSASHVAITGFTLTGMMVPINEGCINIRPGCENVYVTNCVVRNPPNVLGVMAASRITELPIKNVTIQGCSFIDSQYHAISITGEAHMIMRNYFKSPYGWDAIRANCSNSMIVWNEFDNWSNLAENSNHCDILQAFGDNGNSSTNNLFACNFAHDCVRTQMANMSDGSGVRVHHWTLAHNSFARVSGPLNIYIHSVDVLYNTFFWCAQSAAHPILFQNLTSTGVHGTAHNCRAIGNMFYACGSNPNHSGNGWYWAAAGVENLFKDYNMVSGANHLPKKSGVPGGFNDLHGINGGDPKFANTNPYDFSLLPGSPAIGAGVDLTSLGINYDIGGKVRTTWDIGAFAKQ